MFEISSVSVQFFAILLTAIVAVSIHFHNKKHPKEMAKDETLIVSVDVTNAGAIAAKEVVQLYIKDLIGSVIRPDKELKGFQKIELNPGETKTVEFTITPEMLKFTGLEMKPVLEAGDYHVMLGTSSVDYQTKSFKLK